MHYNMVHTVVHRVVHRVVKTDLVEEKRTCAYFITFPMASFDHGVCLIQSSGHGRGRPPHLQKGHRDDAYITSEAHFTL